MGTPHLRAAIDIGTNSVLLLVAGARNGEIAAVRQEARITRLGEGVRRSGVLDDAAMQRTEAALAEYAEICRTEGIDSVAAVGTAALRRATNGNIFIGNVQKQIGLDITIIPESREAELTYRGSASSFGRDILVLDIGGGSTECILPRPDGITARSLDLGVVSLNEETLAGDPPSLRERSAARDHIRSVLRSDLQEALPYARDLAFVATAGTATTLAAMHRGIDFDPDRVHGTRLGIGDIDALIDRMAGRTSGDIRGMKGVQAGREDVILPGALIMREAMAFFGHRHAIVSDRGVRWGVLWEQFTREGRL